MTGENFFCTFPEIIHNMRKFIFLISLFFIGNTGFSQINLWKTSLPAATAEKGYQIKTTSNNFFYFDIIAFKNLVKSNPNGGFVISLPVGDKEFVDFKLTINTTISGELMDKYTEIRAYDGYAMDGSKRKAKVDIGPDYFRAMILQPGQETIFIDPSVFTQSLQNNYVLYKKSELITEKNFSCHQKGESNLAAEDVFQSKAVQSCELRTYRVAIAATGEYTAFQGGTVAKALAAQVTTMNRVNGIYERDLAITMTMIANNDQIIYTNASTDPYSNGNPDEMIDENPTNINNVIGVSNYDIGHVFGTNSGGLANLGCVCSNSMKAGGVTGSGAPVGDAFDIDYVAHEMGHQFGANHTFNNSCDGNRNSPTAMEPGSGSTIMSYAGICSPNVQSNSNDYFHAISLQEIGIEISTSSHTCAVKSPLNNVAPAISGTTGSVTIPAGTPFMLKATATDADGDNLTYCWEQMDKEITQQAPQATAVKGPSFRSYSPAGSPVRYFPSISNQLSSSYAWERLSTKTRTYKFRVTVRDNAENGGCTEYQDVTLSATASAGPFVVTYPNLASVTWTGLTTPTVTWNVANTDVAPVSCENVKISISVDGGLTFTTLIESTPNDGSEEITVPNVNTTKAIILISSENETFFDISDRLFKIVASELGTDNLTATDFSLYPNPSNGLITVNFNTFDYISGFRIYNASGKLVMEETKNISSDAVIDISRLDTGVYFFETVINNQKSVYKLIKN